MKDNPIHSIIYNLRKNYPQLSPGISDDEADLSPLMAVNRGFISVISGSRDPLYEESLLLLEETASQEGEASETAAFYLELLPEIENEMEELFQDKRRVVEDTLNLSEEKGREEELTKGLYSLFFPEGLIDADSPEEDIAALRQKRTCTIINENTSPVKSVPGELLFTSNALLTIPDSSCDVAALGLPDDMTQALVETMKQEQLYWYDHPIQVGTPVEANEVIYGLKGLNEAVAFEKEEGHVKADEKVSVLLSLSVTHQGLRSLGRRYLEVELKKAGMLEHLQVYIVTEKDTERLFHEVLIPAMEILGIEGEKDTMLQVFGVDGEYGRHYTFLKFVSLVWRDFISQSLKATFKIDLDQVFPQEVLVKETGKTAFQHLQTPLWGAVGIDSHGKRIYCGLIAGALVNQADIHRGLFSPDVPFKEKQPLADELFFNSSLPQALSTEGEMMTQYKEGTDIDGRKSALQRIHVTGGTNGILVDALERYRPFTPSVIGRAEDQAFILSVLQDEVKDETLRYVHEPGLIMRHDKEAFAIAAITAAKTGKVIGDYIRILYFSSYASSLPRGMHSVKDEIDPFTGSFVTPHPVTTVALRLAWKSAALSRDNLPEGEKLLREGARRIGSALRFLRQSDNFTTVYQSEKKAWHAIYDVMKGIGLSDDSALRALADKGASIINNTRIKDE